MKFLMIIMLLPVFSFAQMVHLKDDKIHYKGKLPAISAVKSTVENALVAADVKYEFLHGGSENAVIVKGESKLPTPFSHIRKLHFQMQVMPAEKGMTYSIDSVYLTEQRRGSTLKTKTSKDLINDFESGGPTRDATERILNQIDLKFQQILALIKRNETAANN